MAFLCGYIQRLCEAAFPGYMSTPLEITLCVFLLSPKMARLFSVLLLSCSLACYLWSLEMQVSESIRCGFARAPLAYFLYSIIWYHLFPLTVQIFKFLALGDRKKYVYHSCYMSLIFRCSHELPAHSDRILSSHRDMCIFERVRVWKSLLKNIKFRKSFQYRHSCLVSPCCFLTYSFIEIQFT